MLLPLRMAAAGYVLAMALSWPATAQPVGQIWATWEGSASWLMLPLILRTHPGRWIRVPPVPAYRSPEEAPLTANQSLPASLYLLAYNTRKNELAKKAWLDYLIRGAVLCELIIGGYLVEVSRRPRAAANGQGARQPADPMLSWVLDELRGDTGLTWRRLLRQDAAQSLAAIEQRLAQQRLISAGPGGSVTGRVTAADPAAIESMQESVRAALTGQVDPAALAARDAALAALAAVVPLPTVISRREARRNAAALAALGDRAAEQSPALRSLIAQMRRTRGRSFSAAGPVR